MKEKLLLPAIVLTIIIFSGCYEAELFLQPESNEAILKIRQILPASGEFKKEEYLKDYISPVSKVTSFSLKDEERIRENQRIKRTF